MKLMSGSKFPKGIGIDFSGIMAETGTAVTNYKKGDEVYGILDVFKGKALFEYIFLWELSAVFYRNGVIVIVRSPK